MSSNTVTINDGAKAIMSISYVTNSLVITSGKSASPPPTISGSNNVWRITLDNPLGAR